MFKGTQVRGTPTHTHTPTQIQTNHTLAQTSFSPNSPFFSLFHLCVYVPVYIWIDNGIMCGLSQCLRVYVCSLSLSFPVSLSLSPSLSLSLSLSIAIYLSIFLRESVL